MPFVSKNIKYTFGRCWSSWPNSEVLLALRNSMIWSKTYFFHFSNFCVFNPSCLYRTEEVNKTVQKLRLGETLIEEILNYTGPHPAANIGAKPQAIQILAEPFLRLTERHYSSLLPKNSGRGRKECQKTEKCVPCNLLQPQGWIGNKL